MNDFLFHHNRVGACLSDQGNPYIPVARKNGGLPSVPVAAATAVYEEAPSRLRCILARLHHVEGSEGMN